MHRLIYVSRSSVAGQTDIVADIVLSSAARGAVVGVTGMLWSDGGYFVQVLEGPIEPLTATFVRISAESRHTGLEIVVNHEIRQPVFGTWSMVEADESEAATDNAAFLLGLTHDQNTPAKRRLLEVIYSSLHQLAASHSGSCRNSKLRPHGLQSPCLRRCSTTITPFRHPLLNTFGVTSVALSFCAFR